MKKLTQKNNFDSSKFSDVSLNMIVSILICLGYAVDYSVKVISVILFLEGVIDLNGEALAMTVAKLFLSMSVFSAYIILMRVFMTYQNQVNEAAARIEEAKRKAKRKAEKLAKQKHEEQAISGETGVTPSHKVEHAEDEAEEVPVAIQK